jgi:hypothetical protein
MTKETVFAVSSMPVRPQRSIFCADIAILFSGSRLGELDCLRSGRFFLEKQLRFDGRLSGL